MDLKPDISGFSVNYSCLMLGHYLMIFCFSSENSKFEVRAGGSLPLSIIIKMICKCVAKDLNQYKIPVYRDPPLMCKQIALAR